MQVVRLLLLTTDLLVVQTAEVKRKSPMNSSHHRVQKYNNDIVK